MLTPDINNNFIIRRLRKRCQCEFIEFVGIKFKGNTAVPVRIVIVNWVKLLSLLSIVPTNRLRFFLRHCPIYTSNHGYREGKIDSREALCALVLASGLSPVFLVCGVGQGMFSNALTGVRILISSMAAQVVCALIAARLPIPRRKNCREEERRTPEEKGAISFGVNAALGICGWMVLFSVYTGGLPEFYGAWFEVSKGCAYAAETGNETLACAIACLSGACVFMQNAAGIYPAALETALFFTFKCIQCALGTSFFVLTDAFLKRKIEFEADLFTVSAAGAMTLACLILFLFAKEQRKKSYGDQKTGH